jgi:hypothetical protein
MRSAFAAALLLGAAAAPPQARYALLPSSTAAKLVDQCSRIGYKLSGTWSPTAADIEQLERDLPKLDGATVKGCCISGARLDDARDSLRQYVGVIIRGRRYIYINAFPLTELENWPPAAPAPPDWHTEPVIICDGGQHYWGALYDPAKHRFSDFSVNGVG